MHSKLLYSVLFSLCFFSVAIAQEDELIIEKDSTVVTQKIVYFQGIDPLSPSRAAFYSAVLPGLGQVYNKKYWKVPIVWAAMSTGVYFYVDNDKEYNRYRTAFKLRKAGLQDEFTQDDGTVLISEDGLIRAQDVLKKNRDLSLFITIGLYALNILEANVDAHLPDKALDKTLSFQPSFFTESITNQPMFGVTMNFKF